MTRIPVNPELLTRTRERAGRDARAQAGRPNTGASTPREGTHE
jgi:hypothetical protein